MLLLLIPLWGFSDHLYAKEEKLLVLGDSLSAAYNLKQEQGWVSLLQSAWQSEDITVVNAAISGETSGGGLARLPRLLEQHQPTHLFIELGGNDGLRGYPIKKMKTNISSMIQLAQKQGIEVILQQMQIPSNYGRRYTQSFSKSYQELATQYDIALIPFLLEEIALNKSLMQRDGIHPTAEAQPIIAEFMAVQLLPHIQD